MLPNGSTGFSQSLWCLQGRLAIQGGGQGFLDASQNLSRPFKILKGSSSPLEALKKAVSPGPALGELWPALSRSPFGPALASPGPALG